MTPSQLIADAIVANKELVGRYLVGFDDRNRTTQPPGLPNHVAWSLGHCALVMSRVAEQFDGKGLPAGEIEAGSPSLPRGAGERNSFLTETVAYGSTPVDDPKLYPPMARCHAIFNHACDRLADAVRGAGEAKLNEVVPWGGASLALGMLALRMSFHNGTHTGQIADIRRALGMKSIFA